MMKLRTRALSCAGLALAVFLPALGAACSSRPGSGGASASPAAGAAVAEGVAAEVGGESISLAEVDRRVLERVAQDRLFEMRQAILDDVVAEKLLAREARARGLSEQDLLRTEVDAKVAPVQEADIKQLFDGSGLAQRGASLEQFRTQIASSIRERRAAERKAKFVEELRGKTTVRVVLKEPRTEVAVPADAPALGPAAAPVTMVEFLDYQCPYCHRVQGVVDQVLARYPDKVRFVHRDFLLGNPRSLPAARAARCAGDQGKFWEYHRQLLGDPRHEDADLQRKAASLGLDGGRFSTCVASNRHDPAIESATAQGREAGVTGTPTFFINGRRVVGVKPLEELTRIIDEELKRS
jgi:protein-disulfide isomerase